VIKVSVRQHDRLTGNPVSIRTSSSIADASAKGGPGIDQQGAAFSGDQGRR
jgi:hypothetical protein